jgi:hypothetical protein
MTGTDGLTLQVLPVADSDAEELADLGAELHAELLSVDGASVAPLSAEAAPEGAKGLGDVAGWLVAQFGTLACLRFSDRHNVVYAAAGRVAMPTCRNRVCIPMRRFS